MDEREAHGFKVGCLWGIMATIFMLTCLLAMQFVIKVLASI